MGDVGNGWIGEGTAAPPDPAEAAERAPSLVVSVAHSAFGAVRRRQVRVGGVTVILAAAGVGVVRRDGAARGTGPTSVVTDELAWVDGGADGLWTVRPGGPDDVAIDRGTPAEVGAALAGMVRAAEGC
jgi:hypothetical protein